MSIPYAGWPPTYTGSASAGAPMSAPPGPGPAFPPLQPEQEVPGEIGMLLPLELWSYTSVMVHVVPAQNEFSGATLTTPPADFRPTLGKVESEARWTWYSGPL